MTPMPNHFWTLSKLLGLRLFAGTRPCAFAMSLLMSCAPLYATPSDFYSATVSEIAGAPGTLIRKEPVVGAPESASAYRVLYRSTGLDGKPIAVSGFVVVPSGGASPSGRPIVAWAHPTTGVVSQCAPSLSRLAFADVRGLAEMLKLGYVVAATDYPGLGTATTHPYLIGESEGRAVLDSVRVARTLPGVGNGARFIAWGHSQGGQAALYAGILAKSYAPELELMGVAAAAPATDLGTLLRDDFKTAGGKNLTAMALWSWDKVFSAPMDKIVAPEAVETVNKLSSGCIESLFDILERAHEETPLNTTFLTVPDITTVEPWKTLIENNSPGLLPSDIPVFLAQGTADQVVQPEVTERYRARLCAAGSAVKMMSIAGDGHAFIARNSAGAAVEWMRERFDAMAAPNNCSH
jgi:pimeloyl-ACP methyl ester carboxylesterase